MKVIGLLALIFLGRDESNGDIDKDFGKENKIFQLAVLPAWQGMEAVILRDVAGKI